MNEIRYTIRLLYLPVRGPYRNVQQRHLLSDRKIYISRSSETTSSIFQNNLVVQFGVFLPSAHNESRGHGSVGITLSSVQAQPMNYTSFFLRRNFMEPPLILPEVVISYEIIGSGTLGRLGFLLRVRKNRALELRLYTTMYLISTMSRSYFSSPAFFTTLLLPAVLIPSNGNPCHLLYS